MKRSTWRHSLAVLVLVALMSSCGEDGGGISGEWRDYFSDGTYEEMNLDSDLSGNASMYWACDGFGFSIWRVTRADLGGDRYQLTFTCPDDPCCSSAGTMTMSCTLVGDTLPCTANGAGYTDFRFYWERP